VDQEQLRIAGLTGVEITLDIAGAGSRTYAFVIDWHIRLLLAIAWYVSALEFCRVFAGTHTFKSLMLFTGVPAACIYFFYHPVLEVLLRGRTPGKRMAGVRIVTRNGGTPSVGALIIRNVFRLLDAAPALYLIGLLCCLLTAQRVRIGDMAAGTLLVREEASSAKSLSQLGTLVAQSGLAPEAVELIDDLLQRWHSLEPGHRGALARAVLLRVDDTLTPDALAHAGDTELRQRLQGQLAGLRRPAA
jgi:uncharacterized RDD family membrane protein YckC